MGREKEQKEVKKVLKKKVIKKNEKSKSPFLKKKAEIEAKKLERKRIKKEKDRKAEKKKEAIEEEEMHFDKELFDKQGYYSAPKEDEEITSEDKALLEKFNNSTLTMAILSSLQEKEAQQPQEEEESSEKLDDKVVEVYSKIAEILQKYSSGQLPKPFKVIPQCESWNKLLKLTKPEAWTPNAMAQAVKAFASTMTSRMFESFLRNSFLPAVRKDIQEHKKLNSHYYIAIKRALFKQAAFFKGFLFPFSAQASVKESIIIGSVLKKMSIPVLHGSVAIIKLTELPFSVGTGYFLRTLISKNYSLSGKVIEAIVKYFCSFISDSRELPVLWHQSLLLFVSKYYLFLNAEHKAAIKELIKIKSHHIISPEIGKALEPSVSSMTDI